MTGWTDERRRKQAETIRKHKPWEKSTGPKTRKGKARASLNALKSGSHSRSRQAMRKALRNNREFLKNLEIYSLLESLMRVQTLQNPTVRKSKHVKRTIEK